MPALPNQIRGKIRLRATESRNDLPKFGNEEAGQAGSCAWIGSATPQELYIKTPNVQNSTITGATANYLSYLYLNNAYYLSKFFDSIASADFAAASCFAPNFYVDGYTNEPKIGWNYTNNGSINFASAPNSGNSGDRFEVFYLQYTTGSFLTAAGGGATASAITGITFTHDILPGNTTLSAQQIYYRKIGNVNSPAPVPEE